MGFRFQKRKGGESVDPYYRMSNRPLRSVITPVNTAIIAVNVIVFLWLTAAGSTHDALFMYNHGANYWPAVIYRHEYYRLLSCAFLHFGIAHLFNNMLVLGFLGDNLERALGRIRYAVFYLFCAVGSSAVSMAWSMYTDYRGLSAGASGQVSRPVSDPCLPLVTFVAFPPDVVIGIRSLIFRRKRKVLFRPFPAQLRVRLCKVMLS